VAAQLGDVVTQPVSAEPLGDRRPQSDRRRLVSADGSAQNLPNLFLRRTVVRLRAPLERALHVILELANNQLGHP
jgi:hypothetical protein